jgi:hypothetical protein
MTAAGLKAELEPNAALPALLAADHAALQARLLHALSAFRTGAREEAAAHWVGFERELEAHLALAEHYVLPELAKRDPAEAVALRAEHADLRCRLHRLGTGLDLQLTREASIAEFCTALAAHAAREERALGGFAQHDLPERSRAALRALLLDARQRFLSLRGGRNQGQQT